MMKSSLTREQLIEIFTSAWFEAAAEAKRNELAGLGLAPKGTKVGAGLDAVFAAIDFTPHVPVTSKPTYSTEGDLDVWSTCHFCGTDTWNGYEDRMKLKRHWLSDCRPDLVEHPVGPLCTWTLLPYDTRDPQWFTDEQTDNFNRDQDRPGCYAYQDRGSLVWTKEHTHFYPDGPM